MELAIRPATEADAAECGRICHVAFAAIARRHGFPPDFPSSDIAAAHLSRLIAHPNFFAIVAEYDGKIVGSNFLDERSMIFGVGPITVDPEMQDRQIGRALMNKVLERSQQKFATGIRLVQAGYHSRSLGLYAKLGFAVREPLAVLQGDPRSVLVPGREVRNGTDDDVDSCNELCSRVHGHDRSGELTDAIIQGNAKVVEHQGRITGYSTGISYIGHTVAECNEDVVALIGATREIFGPGFLAPLRSTDLLRWCLNEGLRIVYTMNLMTIGFYQEPRGLYLASVLY